MAATNRLSASEQTALNLACKAFSDATQRYRAEPRKGDATLADMVDAVVHFSVSGKQFDMPVVIAPNAASHGAAAVLQRTRSRPERSADRPLMLITYHVSPKLAEDLIARRIPFLDTAGNAYLDEPEATVMIVGRDKPARKHTDTTSRSTTPKGMCVSFALVTQPDLAQQPYRTIADQSGVALNTVNLAVDDLIARGLVVQKRGRRVIADRRRFIEDWVNLYPTRLRRKLAAQRFASSRGIEWWQSAYLSEYDARLGGESAAEFLTHEIKPASIILYAHAGASSSLMRDARLRPDPQGEVEVLESFWPQHAERSWDVQPGIVHPLLIYADLIATGDSRNHAVAQALHERYLAS